MLILCLPLHRPLAVGAIAWLVLLEPVFAAKPVWTTVAQSNDKRGQIEVDRNSVVRDREKVRVMLRITTPNEMPVGPSRTVSSRFSLVLIEFECPTRKARYLKTTWLPSRNSNQVLSEEGPYEEYEVLLGTPISRALTYSCNRAAAK
jgi:hypothetical protein